MADNIINIGAKADLSEFTAAMGGAVEVVQESMAEIKAAFEAARVIKEFIDHIKEQVLETDHLSAATGISVDKITELKDALAEAGASSENLPAQLTALAHSMSLATQGSAEQADAFRKLGVDTSGWADKMPSTIDVLQQLGSHLPKSTASTSDLAKMSVIFGGDVVALTDFLRQNGGQLNQVTQKYLEHGIEVEKSVSAAKHLQQEEAELTTELKTALLPIFRTVVDAIDGLRIMYEVTAVAITAFGSRALTVGSAVADAFSGTLTIIKDAVSGNFKAIPADAHNALLLLKADVAKYDQIAIDQASETQRRIAGILQRPAVLTPGGGPPPPPAPHPGRDGKNVSDLQQDPNKNEQVLQVQLADIELLKAKAIASYTEMGDSFEEAKAKADAMFSNDELTAHLNFFDKQEAAAATDDDKESVRRQRKVFLDQEQVKTILGLAHAQGQFNEATAKESREIAAQAEKQLAANVRLDERTRLIVDLISVTKAETDAEAHQAALQQIHSFAHANSIALEIREMEKLRAAAAKQGLDTLAFDAAVHQAELRKLQDQQKLLLSTNKLGNAFKALFKQMQIEAQQSSERIYQAFKQAVDGMNQALTQFVVEGKANWQQLIASMIEGLIQVVLQKIETMAAMEILDALGLGKKKAKNAEEAHSSANTAAANTLADVPFPENIPASATVLAIGEGFGAAAVAEGGQWEVPGVQPTILHPQEMVLPAGIASRMRDLVESGGTFASGSPHLVFAPTIHALDAEGVDRVLIRHQRIFENRVDKVLKKRGFFAK